MNNDIIELYFKDTINIPFIFTDNNGAPINISNANLLFIVKQNLDDNITLINENFIVPSDNNSLKGIYNIYIQQDLPVGNYFYGLIYITNLNQSNEVRQTVVCDKLLIKANIIN